MAERRQRGPIECVYLTCFQTEFASLALVMRYSGVRVHRAESIEEADFLLTAAGATVFLTDVSVPDGGWRDALAMVSGLHATVPCLIAADPVDRPFLLDAEACGACGVLWRPWNFLHTIERIQACHQASRDRAACLAEEARQCTATVRHSERKPLGTTTSLPGN